MVTNSGSFLEVDVLSEAERQQFQLYEFRCVFCNELVVDRPAGFAPKMHNTDRGQGMVMRWPVCIRCVDEG